MKLQQLKNGAYVLTLPKQIILAKQWQKGDDIKIMIDKEGNIVLKK